MSKSIKHGSPEVLKEFAGIPLSNETDLWSFGAVLWDLFHTHLGEDDCQETRLAAISDVEAEDNFFTLEPEMWNSAKQPVFSDKLWHMMKVCCARLPETRITPLALMQGSENRLARLPSIVGDFTGEVPHRLQLRYKEDEYKLDRRWRGIKRKGRDEYDNSSDEDDEDDDNPDVTDKRGKRIRRIGPPGQETEETEYLSDVGDDSTRWTHRLCGAYPDSEDEDGDADALSLSGDKRDDLLARG